jgi:hypothetical protein
MKQIGVLAVLAIIVLSSTSLALQSFSGSNVYINSPVDDDIFASGSQINIDAPVSSATVFGGNINVNAPVAGDLIVAGGQVTINSNVGGKVLAAGGNLDIRGNISKNALLVGGQVDIRPDAIIGKDVFVSGGTVNNAGHINGNLTVSASDFRNTGTAGGVLFHQINTKQQEQVYPINPFSVLMTLGYLIAGLLFIHFFPALFIAVDSEVRSKTAFKTISGFVLLISGFILIILAALTVIGIPLAVIVGLLITLTIMLSGIFVAFSLGRSIFDLIKFKTNDLVIFLIGFLILNGVFYIPIAGSFIKMIAVSLGFGAILFAVKNDGFYFARSA